MSKDIGNEKLVDCNEKKLANRPKSAESKSQ